MMLNQKIVEDLKEAMKAKDQARTSCLRMLKTAVKNEQVNKGRELKDEEIQAIISSSIKKCKDAVNEFRAGGREDLAEKEEKEIQLLFEYLPKQLTPEEIESTLRDIISELSAGSPKDLGKVMKVAMARMAGQAQGKEVNEIARRLLQ
jgi:uncharacterized protein YqeY